MIPFKLDYAENGSGQITGVFLPLTSETVELVEITRNKKKISKMFELKNEISILGLDEKELKRVNATLDHVLNKLYEKQNKLTKNYERDYLRKWDWLVEDAKELLDRYNGRISLPAAKRTTANTMNESETTQFMFNSTKKKTEEIFYNLLKRKGASEDE